MRKWLLLLIALVFLCMLTGCMGASTADYPWGVSDSALGTKLSDDILIAIPEEGTLTSQSITFTLTNPSNDELWFGTDYHIEVCLGKQWYKINFPEKWDWTCEALICPPQDSLTVSINWLHPFGELPAGRYRIVKEEFWDNTGISATVCEFELP